jgi:hypothetical protein
MSFNVADRKIGRGDHRMTTVTLLASRTDALVTGQVPQRGARYDQQGATR